MATRITTARRNAAADSVVDAIDVGTGTAVLQIRSGAQPASANDVDAGTLLASFNLPNPAFGAAAVGVATAAAITDTTGSAAGDAGHFRVKDRNGVTVMDGSVATSGADLNLNTVTISVGVNVSVTSWTVTMPAG